MRPSHHTRWCEECHISHCCATQFLVIDPVERDEGLKVPFFLLVVGWQKEWLIMMSLPVAFLDGYVGAKTRHAPDDNPPIFSTDCDQVFHRVWTWYQLKVLVGVPFKLDTLQAVIDVIKSEA